MSLVIKNARIITPAGVQSRGWLLCQQGRIAARGSGDAPTPDGATVLEAAGQTLLPGFVDVHVHGGDGVDTMDADPAALATMARFFARHGVTSFLATTWTDTPARTTAALAAIRQAQGRQPGGATLLGAHLEGPYLNPAKGGAQNLSQIRRATRAEALPWLDTGVIKLLSLAPEYEENHWLIVECRTRGITVSAAHTDATFEQARQAIDLGITHATHTFNAMPPLHHRDPGVLGAVLGSAVVRCELIADNVHVHPGSMAILWRLKRPNQLILITDAIRAAGQPDGVYPVDERQVTVQDGSARLPDGTLAGSTLTMERALWHLMQATGEPLENVWQCASLNPAKAIHVANQKGSIEIGKDADLVLVDDGLAVQTTIIGGEVVYQKAARP
ncbi:MAG: N-acetylglucosamine-6-phosphate deacetylase [Anaerolineae bacterium]|nr:N-acetylglucosamine-6-phosphate deacetylase [Anaerolineae bacterium]